MNPALDAMLQDRQDIGWWRQHAVARRLREEEIMRGVLQEAWYRDRAAERVANGERMRAKNLRRGKRGRR